MELIKIVIHSLFGTKPFDNVFCVTVGDGDLEPTTEESIYGAVYGQPPVEFWNKWDNNDPDYPEDPAVLQAIVSFMTQLRFVNITITGATISDGQVDTDKFFPVAINQPGTRPYPSGDPGKVAPGNIIWDIVKTPAQMGINYGHIELRAALSDDEIAMSGADLLGWTDNSTKSLMSLLMNDSITDSSLEDYFYLSAGGSPGYNLAIPRAFDKDSLHPGSWYGAVPILNFAVGEPRSRQVHRGKKKKAAPTP